MATATNPLANDEHGNTLRREVAEYEAQLQAELTPAQWRLVERLTDAQGALDHAEQTDELDRHVEALARHVGTLAPLIRALHWHLVDETAGREVDECGLFPDLRPYPPNGSTSTNKCLGLAGQT